jgi:hypothetical protein
MRNGKIEISAGDTILQNPKTINVGNETYEVSPPVVATMIEVSRYVALIPEFVFEEENVFQNILLNTKHCDVIGDIIAILILGKKNLTKIVKTKNIFGKIRTKALINRQAELKEEILNNLSMEQCYNLLVEMLEFQKIGFFLNTIKLLNEIAMLRAK